MGSSASIVSGNLYHDQTLFQIPNTKPALDFTLSYNSLDTYTGPLGKGWTHSFNINITKNSSQSLTLMKADGKRVNFTSGGAAYYSDVKTGEHSVIVASTNNYTLTAKDGTTYTFNTQGKLFQIKDRNNNTTTLAYSGDDLASITDSSGRIIAVTTSNGRIITITDPSSKVYTVGYAGDILSAIIDQQNNTWQYTYDANGRMLTKIDPQGYTTTYTYDSSGRVTTSIDPEGKTKTILYDQTNNVGTITEKDGGVWIYKYDNSLNVPLQITDPQGNITQKTYDSNANLISKTDPDGTTTTYTYDAQGNMTSTTDALNQTTSYTYNSYGQVTSITDPQGNTTTYTYDASGNLTSATDPTGAATQYQYDTRGNITQITNANGQTTKLTYDQNNNLISITDPVGQSFSFAYDAAGNMTSQTDASGATTYFQYNSLNQLIKITDPSGNVTIFSYDANGNRTSQTDANGNVTKYEYNYKGQLTKVTDSLGNITTYIYGGTGCPTCQGGADKLTTITDAKNQTTTYEYDTLGRLIKETNTLGNIITYSYDAKGNLISKKDANGNTITYTYDSLNRLIAINYPDSTKTTFTYDTKGNILTAANQHITYYFTYDANGRILTVTDSNGRNINYEYNPLGNKIKLTYPDGTVVEYSYDNANRLSAIINGSGRTYSFQYDTLGRRTKLSMPNGTYTTYAYDNAGRLTDLIHKTSSGTIIDSFTYTHDKVGNRLTKTETDKKYDYVYDAIYRLTEALSSTPGYSSNTAGKGSGITTATQQQKEFYTYDPVGNRLSSDKYSAYSYNAANQLLSNGGAYAYDKNGNLTSKTEGTTSYSYFYDYENRLTKVNKTENSATTTSEYKYDPFGRRIEKKITELGVTATTRFVYDNEDIILEYDANGNIGNRYIHGPGIDEPLVVTNNKGTFYYHADGLGSIVALTDSNGKTQQTYEYDSFGNLKDQKNKIKQPYTYTGREWDKEAGLYFYRARYYDPKVGRFISKDPIGFEGGDVNLYGYVLNNPVNGIDPAGLASPWHFDYSNAGERLIHYGQYRFNQLGQLVEHTGKVIGEATGKALKALEYLKNVKPDFFLRTPLIFIDPCIMDPSFPGCNNSCPVT